VQLLYDPRDDAYHERLGSRILYWLDDVGAVPLAEAHPGCEGFLFAGARPIADYRRLVAELPLVRDRAEEREPLLRLDTVLQTLGDAGVAVRSPRTWTLALDAPLPDDLTFPLFVRTAESSWKKGGRISRVRSPGELEAEAAELRRALGWDAVILAREWLDLAAAGESRYGPVAQEVRTWVVDGVPRAWSFHHLHVVPNPKGFPPQDDDLAELRRLAAAVASAFRSRLVVADFARGVDGRWWFIEAGPGSCAGTAHEAVFKAVAGCLLGDPTGLRGDAVGGPL
jgi:ATP-grasp domain, R2K clade family 3